MLPGRIEFEGSIHPGIFLRSRFSQIVLLVVALLAFLPVVAVDHVIDGYVMARETTALQTTVDAITHDSQLTVHEGIQSLRRILANSPSLCAATFVQNVNSELEGNPFLRQVIVENNDGVQYCSAFGHAVQYRVLSENLTIPGHTETLSVIKIDGNETPLLKITQSFGRERTVSALVLASPMLMRNDVPLLGQISYLQVALTSGLARGRAGTSICSRDLSLAKYRSRPRPAFHFPKFARIIRPSISGLQLPRAFWVRSFWSSQFSTPARPISLLSILSAP